VKDDGTMVTEQHELESVAQAFYMNLFTAQDLLEPGTILQHVPVKVKNEMNDVLNLPFTAKEVERALFMMGASKAPGPDGFTMSFYQHHWDILGPSITREVLDFLNGGTILPDELNRITCLIPKVNRPQEMKHFRPISLCNVIY
jgi:hypothetical protein